MNEYIKMDGLRWPRAAKECKACTFTVTKKYVRVHLCKPCRKFIEKTLWVPKHDA